MIALREEYAGRVNVVALYIAEAHAQDEWPISSSRCNRGRGMVCVQQARTMEERVATAQEFVDIFAFQSVPMYCDAIDNAFERQFGAWPLRFYVVASDGALRYAAMPRDCVYDLTEIRAAMDRSCR